MTPCVPVSWGELIDKITILEIKLERLQDPTAQANAARELDALRTALTPLAASAELDRLRDALLAVNRTLWDIEDAIRRKEADQSFDTGFIELARSVYRQNDERARLKRAINVLLRSELMEEKQYVRY